MSNERTGNSSLSKRDFLKLAGTGGLSLTFLAACNAAGVEPEAVYATLTPTKTVVPTTSFTDTPSPIPATETATPTETPKIAEFPAEDDMSIRIWTRTSGNIDKSKDVLGYGLTKTNNYFEYYSPDYTADIYNLSGILLETPVLEGDNMVYKIGIPDYSRNEFIEFTVNDGQIYHESLDPNSPLVYSYGPARKKPVDGFNVSGAIVGMEAAEAPELFNNAVGRQVAFMVFLKDDAASYDEFLEERKVNQCRGVGHCEELIDKVQREIPETMEVMRQLKSGNLNALEGIDLNVWLGLPILPVSE